MARLITFAMLLATLSGSILRLRCAICNSRVYFEVTLLQTFTGDISVVNTEYLQQMQRITSTRRKKIIESTCEDTGCHNQL